MWASSNFCMQFYKSSNNSTPNAPINLFNFINSNTGCMIKFEDMNYEAIVIKTNEKDIGEVLI